MSHKHRAKIEKLFEHPLSGNIDIKKLLSALEHYGAKVEITKHNKAKIFVREEEYILSIPHNHNLSKDEAIKLKHFLEKVDLVPGAL
ncbi:hypothetical protein N9A28_05000 [Sulfurimonas sp.]|nr:hypothetical protein [Sulfurimonas sp.]